MQRRYRWPPRPGPPPPILRSVRPPRAISLVSRAILATHGAETCPSDSNFAQARLALMETDELAPGRTRNPHAESAPTSGRYGPGGLKPLDSPDATTVGERVGIVQTGIEAGNSGGNGTGAQTGCRKLGRGQRQNRVPLINVPSGSGAGIGGPKHNGPAKDVIARVERGGNDVESKKHAVGERHGGRKDSRWEGEHNCFERVDGRN
ncbi:hypothetical protein FS749_008331 [Ceratobasidium sp. UAMH 11750]|nr:hypothetical protein FS749_008331 [Ceratobasidium sp. UAMH 11750]